MKICPTCLVQRPDELDECPDDAALLLPLAGGDARIGTVIADRWIVLSELGRGGMSVVYRGFQRSMDREVAVKILELPEGNEDSDLKERFVREAKATAKLRSPQTVTVFDSGLISNNAMYLAMELLSGRSLQDVAAHVGAMTRARAVKIIDQVCRSLQEAHGLGLVHRDIKPGNVMVTNIAENEIKVVDFGLVKPMDAKEPTLTQTGWMMGTPAYMAPEMWSPEYGPVGPGVDIYAVGAMFFELLTSRRVFDASGVAQLMHSHVYEAPAKLTSVKPDLPGVADLDAIIQKCLAKVPTERFLSITELREALFVFREGAVRGESLSGASAPPISIGSDTELDPNPDVDADTLMRSNPTVEGQDGDAGPGPDHDAGLGPDGPSDTVADPPETTVDHRDDAGRPSAPVSAPSGSKTGTIAAAVLILGGVVVAGWFAVKGSLQPEDAPTAPAQVVQSDLQKTPPSDKAPVPPAATATPAKASAVKSAPKKSIEAGKPKPKPRRRASITSVKGIGINSSQAKAAVDKVGSKLTRCYQNAHLKSEAKIVVILSATGQPKTIKSIPASASSLAGCAKKSLMKTNFGKLDGRSFGTVTITLNAG